MPRLGLALQFAAAALLLSASATQAAPEKEKPQAAVGPMTFYVARGAPHSCGSGCDEWIAAEGEFGVGSIEEFRALLNRLGKQKLPVFFHSPGGLVGEALTIGRMIRERGMTSGLGKTVPDGCVDEAKKKECSELKKSRKKLDAELTMDLGRCNSACVYAVLGGKTRMVSPGSRLGVHAARSVAIANKQVKAIDLSKRTPQEQKESRRRFRDKLRDYVREMGISGKLAELAESVPHEKVHYLTRSQIVDFGIDRSSFAETPWKFIEESGRPVVSKFFMEARGQEKSEFPSNYIRLSCGNGGKATVYYSRGLTAGETGQNQQIKFLLGDEGLSVSSTGQKQYGWIENERFFDVRFAVTDFSRLAHSGEVLEILETSWAAPAPYAHIVRLSTQGWGEAIGRLREKCLKRDEFSGQRSAT